MVYNFVLSQVVLKCDRLSLTVSSVEGNFIYLVSVWKLCYIGVKRTLLVVHYITECEVYFTVGDVPTEHSAFIRGSKQSKDFGLFGPEE